MLYPFDFFLKICYLFLVMNKKDKDAFISYLGRLFPKAECELQYSDSFQFLVAVMLSAQCTDSRVNMVTPKLFEHFSTPSDFANADIVEIENLIKSCGFYHNKAKNIKNASIEIVNRYGGQLPNTIEELMTLPGVGMKTAKVVCGDLYNVDVIAVDTHVKRISNRLGFTNESDPNKISIQLEHIFREDMSKIHHRLVLFGRYHCKAQNPSCSTCEVKNICKYYKQHKI